MAARLKYAIWSIGSVTFVLFALAPLFGNPLT
ncbi:hypothetical protein ALCH109712_08870 [Alkalicoccus chagannorensis]